MKRVIKSSEPTELKTYRRACPASEWETMRNDAFHGGKAAYDAILAKLEADQGGICAYCEIRISRAINTARVEHFVPKALKHPKVNWGLHWYNMLGVCNGGSQFRNDPGQYLEPQSKNLSCDHFKEKAIGIANCLGTLLNPLWIPAVSPLMCLEHATGKWRVHEVNANTACLPRHSHQSASSLVEYTIEKVLNLNCDRLARNRLTALRTLEREIKQARDSRLAPNIFMPNLAKKYLGPKYRGFFSVYRFRLGGYAEAYLKSIGFQG
jgi:uncharacterized protein (TIGR02646 family)